MRAAIAATCGVLLVAAAIACSTELELRDDRDPNAEGGSEGGGDPDAAGDPDVLVLGGDSAPPITADASLDGLSPPGCSAEDKADTGALAPECDRVVFVTSTAVPLNNVLGADAKCTSFAAGANALPRIKGRSFQAWTSNGPDAGPAERFVRATGNYIRADNTLIAAGWDDLTDGALAAPIVHHEGGGIIGNGMLAWTATSVGGRFNGPNCDGWTNFGGTVQVGAIGKMDSQWTAFPAAQSCNQMHFLLCFEK